MEGQVCGWTPPTPTGTAPTRSGSRGGKPTVVFGGGCLARSGNTGLNVGSVTVFVVAAEISAVANAGLLVIHDSSGGDWDSLNAIEIDVMPSPHNFGAARAYYTPTASGQAVIVGTKPTPWAVYSVVFRPDGSQNAYKDGVIAPGGTPTPSTPLGVAGGGLLVGGRFLSGVIDAGYRLLGDIGEIIVYDRVLSATERRQVETYLAARWMS